MNALRTVVALVCALLALACAPARANAPAHAAILSTLDGTSLGEIGIARPGQPPLIAVDKLATAIGWKSTVLTAALRLSGDDRSITLIAGGRTVRENGDLRFAFVEPVLVRAGRWYVRAADAARLFGLSLKTTKKALALARPSLISDAMQVRDVARPTVPKPAPTPRASARNTPAIAMQNAAAGRVTISLERSGGTQFLQFASQTQGAGMQTSLTASGSTSLDTPYATVLLGSNARNTILGMQTDPLNGTIFRGALYEGVSYNRTDTHRSYFAGRRLDTGTDMIGETVGDAFHGGATTVALLARDGRYEETIVRRVTRIHQNWGDFSTETVGGDRGGAVAFGARTRGRTFVEAQASFASHGLPLGQNDAPIGIDLGRVISPALTIAGGFATGPGQPLAPFFGASTHVGALSGSLSVTNRTVTAGASFASSRGSVQAYVVPGAERFSGISGSLYLSSATLELASTTNLGVRESSLTARTIRRGVNLVAGVGLPAGGGVGPIVGLTVPVTPMLSIEGTVRPASGGKQAVRMSLAIGIPSRHPRAEPTVKTMVRITGASSLPMRLFVDGVPVRHFTPPQTTIDVAVGPHVYAVETEDGMFGSLDRAVAADAIGTPVELSLVPVRTLRGRVLLADNAGLPTDFNLAGIVVMLEPNHLTVETAADGTFFFPPLPISPDATLGLDPSLVPREVRAPASQAVGSGENVFLLESALRIERTVFPDSH